MTGLENTIPILLDKNAAANPEKIAIHFDHENLTLTYEKLNKKVNQYANALYNQGIRKSDHIGVMLPNCHQFPIVWLAIAKIGAVMVPINTRYKSNDLEYILANSDSSWLIIHKDYIETYLKIQDRIGRIRKYFMIGVEDEDGATSLDSLVESSSEFFRSLNINSDALINIQYTSGTTGFPKGCMLTHQYWLTIGHIASNFLRPSDIFLSVSPFYYMDPQWELISCFTVGCTMVLGLKYSASNFMKLVANHRITATWATMAAWIYKQPVSKYDRSHNLRFAWVGEFPKSIHKSFEDRFAVKAREVYGSTEVGLAILVPIEDDHMSGSGSIGIPTDFRKTRVIDENGNKTHRGEVGTLLIGGPGMFKGYYKKEKETQSVLKNGWFNTGDLCYQDENGYYYIVGRKKDMIRRSGDNISAIEVENLLRSHPNIFDAAVIAVPDDSRGEEVKAYIIPANNQTPESLPPEEIIDYCLSKIAKFKIPRYIEYRNEFPLTPSNRPIKKALLENSCKWSTKCYDHSIRKYL